MNYRKYIFLFLFGIVCYPAGIMAQDTSVIPTDDLGNVSDAFQESFFEALKQKGIENYELALNALQKAERAAKEDPEQVAVVYFETGKNLKFLKRYQEAEESFQKVIQSQGEHLDVMKELYDLYYLQRNYAKAIPLVQKLILIDPDYKEDLANLYHRTRQYDKALDLLDELDESWGESAYRNALRRRIYSVTGNSEGAINNLETKIDKNPEKEQDYLNLIYLYSEQGDTKKAFEVAKELIKNQPNSQLAHLALYKFYLEEGNSAQAMKSMNVVFGSSKIENESKYKVLADFLNFVGKNPQFEADLDKVISQFSQDGNGQVYEQLGDYFLAKEDKKTALRFYEKGAALDEDNFSVIKNALLLQIDSLKFEQAATLSHNALGTFPAQSLFYLLNGVANNGLEKYDEAIESLEMGLDFILDDPKMERDFYMQLQLANSKKGDTAKANEWAKRAAQINIPN
ncbi:MAG: tetratricopeptide repeat protein [Bacteroidota bacterium]